MLAAGLVDRRGGRRDLRCDLLGEDLVLGLAVDERLELGLLDRLAADEDLRDGVQGLAVLAEDVLRALVRGLDDAADLVVDLARDLVRVVGLGAEFAPEERLRVVVAEDARPEALAHAVAHDHRLRGRRDLLDVVRRAGRDLAEDDLLGGAAAERHRHRVRELRARRRKRSSVGIEIV